MSERVIHWSNWASQPCIQIACTGETFHPWGCDSTLPKDVFNADLKFHPEILYAFDESLVTCNKCKKIDGFQEGLDRVLAYRQKVRESGLTEREYAERETRRTLKMLREKGRLVHDVLGG